MRKLYPETEPYNTFYLATESIHEIYVEEVGNRVGIPVIFLHGGPGSGCNPNHRRYFNPDKYRIIIFDQRGCNRSIPQGELTDNSTEAIIEDMESIRSQLGIERWVLFGGSWGGTLALLYAEAYPEKVVAMILRGTFLARQQDVDWFIKDGVNRLLPDAWMKLMEVVADHREEDLVAVFHELLQDSDKAKRLKAARAWSQWCTCVVTWNSMGADIRKDSDSTGEDLSDQRIANEVAIEVHFALNRYFIRENQILNDINRLSGVPVHIIHGRQDITCRAESSWELHHAIPGSTLEIIPAVGHLSSEPPMVDALVRTTDHFFKQLTQQ